MSCWLNVSDAYFKSLGKLTEADKDRLGYCIQGAIEFAERYCRRTFAKAEYDELQTADREGCVVLQNAPVAYVSRLCSGQLDLVTIQNTGASISKASWSTDETTLRLTHYKDGVRVNTALTWADYPTLTTLATAIATVEGWTATVDHGYESWPTVDIVPQQHGNGKSANVVTSWDDYTGWFDFNRKTGIIRGHFPHGYSVRAVYTGGFDPIPEDLRQAVANLAIVAFTSPEGKKQQENLGGYSYTLATLDQVTMSDKKVLASYRNRIV
jgi:hypothetical protein